MLPLHKLIRYMKNIDTIYENITINNINCGVQIRTNRYMRGKLLYSYYNNIEMILYKYKHGKTTYNDYIRSYIPLYGYYYTTVLLTFPLINSLPIRALTYSNKNSNPPSKYTYYDIDEQYYEYSDSGSTDEYIKYKCHTNTDIIDVNYVNIKNKRFITINYSNGKPCKLIVESHRKKNTYIRDIN